MKLITDMQETRSSIFSRRNSLQVNGLRLSVLTKLDAQGNVVKIKTTQLRWLVLFLTFTISMLATLSPFNLAAFQIAQIYDLSPENVLQSTLIFYGIGAIIAFLASIKLVDQFKCITTVLVPIILFFIGTIFLVVSVYTQQPNAILFYCFIFFISLTSCLICVGPTTVASCWFPIQEQLTATTVCSNSYVIGSVFLTIAMSFMLDDTKLPDRYSRNMQDTVDLQKLAKQFLIHRFKIVGWVYFGITLALLVACLMIFKFPKGLPKHKPNLTQVINEQDWKTGLVGIFKNPYAVILMVVSGLYIGTFYLFVQALTIITCSSGYAAWLSKFGFKLGEFLSIKSSDHRDQTLW